MLSLILRTALLIVALRAKPPPKFHGRSLPTNAVRSSFAGPQSNFPGQKPVLGDQVEFRTAL
ncbi:hypothetical protein N657DRAFT_644166 [Parathielavia appendiculata]|uniref:Secreted protein n=1 Tax=Parathielavia appendiculata TaxID=2587402 RepID=A0AAN6U2S6_9PEZI|nr:hypothetical protein N657DRAFT_644166 [Parathielavia appendiculata]